MRRLQRKMRRSWMNTMPTSAVSRMTASSLRACFICDSTRCNSSTRDSFSKRTSSDCRIVLCKRKKMPAQTGKLAASRSPAYISSCCPFSISRKNKANSVVATKATKLIMLACTAPALPKARLQMTRIINIWCGTLCAGKRNSSSADQTSAVTKAAAAKRTSQTRA